MPSEIFEDAFRDITNGCERECTCGIVHFDVYNSRDWEEGELDRLLKLQTEKPGRYISHDHSVGCYIIDGKEYVFGCPCKFGDKYEKFIRDHSSQIAVYLNKWSEVLKEKSEKIKVRGAGE